MTDILKDLEARMAALSGVGPWSELHKGQSTYILLSRAAAEIARLRKANSDMGWELNPDRMGGQFTDEEINRGNEWR
jgi:hypothetical protein